MLAYSSTHILAFIVTNLFFYSGIRMHTHEHMATHDDPHDGNLLSILPHHEAPLGREADQLGENSFKIFSPMIVTDFVLYL